MIKHTVPSKLRQEELSRYLKRAWPLLPGHVLRELLKKKDVRIGGVKSGKGDLVRGGDTLEIYAADKYFPNLDREPQWKLTADSDEQTYFDLEYVFTIYERVK